MIQRQRGDPWKPGTADLRAWCGAEKGQGGRARATRSLRIAPLSSRNTPQNRRWGQIWLFQKRRPGGTKPGAITRSERGGVGRGPGGDLGVFSAG